MTGTLHTSDYTAFIDAMVKMRIEAGLTQAELAARLGRTQSFVSRCEQRERRVDVVEFIQIATALGVEPEGALKRVELALNMPR